VSKPNSPLRVQAIPGQTLGCTELPALCRRWKVRRLDLFGSATTGHFDAAMSDLDFLVDFEPLEPAAYARAYFGLREGLQVLFGREVDLVTQASLTNPYFRRRVESERRNLFPQT
jgi:predicted nucleotidyltransferase